MTVRVHPRRRPPAAVLAVAILGGAFFALPLVALLGRAPWRALPAHLTSDLALDALRLSLVASLATTLVGLVLGVPLAFVLARGRFAGRSLLRGVVLVPLVLPPVVGGTALLAAFGADGPVGRIVADAGVSLPFSLAGVVLATSFVSVPFLVITVEGALRSLDPGFEAAARTLGAGPWTVLRRVTLPLLRPALLAGAVLTWARALGEFGATLTFAGNVPGTRTLPLAVFVALERDREEALALSLLLVVISLAVIVALRDRWWTS